MSKPMVCCKYRRDLEDGRIYCGKNGNFLHQPYLCSKEHCDDCEYPVLAEVIIKVARCDECPYCKTKRTMGAGDAYDYLCGAKRNKLITGYVEYMSELGPVPDWCPFYKGGKK